MSDKISRRDFLKLTGVGAAVTAVLTGCGPAARYVTRKPYADMPEYNQTGVSTYFATACRECPAGCGLVMRTKEGRALKAEGNPNHPVNRGKLCSRGLTSVQGLYNPDRIQAPRKQTRGGQSFEKVDWNTAVGVVKEALQGAPQGIAFLMGLLPDHLFDLVGELAAALGSPAPLRYGTLAMFEGRATLIEAVRRAFGRPALPYFDLGQADVVFSFGANFLETWLSPLEYSRGFRNLRQGHANRRGYLVSFEPRQSVTSASADEWVALPPGSEGLLAAALGRRIADLRAVPAGAFAGVDVTAAAQAAGISEDRLLELARMLSAAERPLVIPGGGALGHAGGLAAADAILELNRLLGNLGQPGGVYLKPETAQSNPLSDVQALIQRMKSGKVKTLFIHGTNPLFELPPALGFAEALANVPQVISFATFPDETAAQADYIFPDHAGLESFGYQRLLAGGDREILSGSQPVVVPVFDTRATADVLLGAVQAIGGNLTGKLPYTDEVDFLQKKLLPYREAGGSYTAPEILTFWSKFLQSGGWWKNAASLQVPGERAADGGFSLPAAPHAVEDGKFHLLAYPTQLGDGSGANRPWLQETPDPMTTVMWNSWVEIHPDTAAKLGIQDDDVVKITSPAGAVEAVAYLYPAIRPDTIAIPFGQGHTALGRWAAGRGCNPAILMEASLNEAGDLAHADTLVTLTRTGKTRKLARLESRAGVYGKHD